ncbi:predicted protein [Postia placenta Mad-698-R]|nr:predicted protein [Postia placenta Mad-698-R]
MVATLDEFKQNWALFTEGSLSQLTDWNNVVAAGGAVQACLSPVPASAKVSKRALRKHFHNTAYPTSDVDLFLYGLTPADAEKKIQKIYEAVRDSVPWDVTCYPYRAVQIVLRLYRSPAEILAGFDVDASCCAYDGRRVWASPRAIVAMMRQCNTVDMTRRSPSYEVRLAKYSSRHFEVYVPTFRRDDVDPTIFERAISRIQGLGRLLVLEKIRNGVARDSYVDARRALRGRPDLQRDWKRHGRKYKGDMKTNLDFTGLEMNDYDTGALHIPYGPGWNARRIDKLVYQTDLGVNSSFNPNNEGRRLHRHPAFFGTMSECLEDCCERRDDVASLLLDVGVDVNAPLPITRGYQSEYTPHHTLLDWIESATHKARAAQGKPSERDTADAVLEAARFLSSQSGWKGKAGEIILADVNDRLPAFKASSDAEKARNERAARDAQDYADMLEGYLLSRGAKTGYEGKEKPTGMPQRDRWSNTVSTLPEHLRLDGMFWHVSAPVAMAVRYDELYEACARGDSDKIQQLCLPGADSKSSQPPLQIAAKFGTNNATACTPLSLAISGRHWDTAKLILAIASAQHVPERNKETASGLMASMRGITLDGDDDDNDESDEDDEPGPEPQEKPLDFVDIAKRTSAIQSQASPKDLMDVSLSWFNGDGTAACGSVLSRAIQDDDFEGFVQIVNMCNTFPELASVLDDAMQSVIMMDRPEMLDVLIHRTGAGINVSTGADETEDDKLDGQKKAQKVYLGLSVHGKKRKDLARSLGKKSREPEKTVDMPLLWHAAKANACSVLRYLHGDRPLSAYCYYASTHSDERAQLLRRTHDLPSVLPVWLGWTSNALNESVVTAAVISGEPDAVQTLLELRPTQMTEALHAKIKFSGFNHVLAAANWGADPALFDLLVKKGVPVTDTDHRGWNIFHHFAVHSSEYHAKLIKRALATLPEDVVEKMLMQQSKGFKYTPLALAVKRHHIDMVRILVETKASPYLLRDVHGMTPLHIAIQEGRPKLTQLLIDASPVDALYMEDGVGSTPLEVAEARALRIITREGFPCRMEIPKACEHNASEQLERCNFDLPTQEREVGRLRAVVGELVKEGRLKAGTKLAMALQAFSERMDAKVAKVRAEQDALEEAEKTRKAAEGTKGPDERTPEVEEETDVLATLEVVRRAVVARGGAQPRLLVHILDVHKSVEKSLAAAGKPTWMQVARKPKNELAPEVEEDVKARLTEGSALSFWGEYMFSQVAPFASEDDMLQE